MLYLIIYQVILLDFFFRSFIVFSDHVEKNNKVVVVTSTNGSLVQALKLLITKFLASINATHIFQKKKTNDYNIYFIYLKIKYILIIIFKKN